MNWDSIENNLDQFDGGVQEQLGMLTDRQFASVVGRLERPAGGYRPGMKIDDEIEGEIDGLEDVDDFEIEMEETPPRMQ